MIGSLGVYNLTPSTVEKYISNSWSFPQNISDLILLPTLFGFEEKLKQCEDRYHIISHLLLPQRRSSLGSGLKV